MAYFCEKTGARVCAPGVAHSAGGHAPDHADTDLHRTAESAAARALAGHAVLSPQVLGRAVDAAVVTLGGPEREPAEDSPDPKAEPLEEEPPSSRPTSLDRRPKTKPR